MFNNKPICLIVESEQISILLSVLERYYYQDVPLDYLLKKEIINKANNILATYLTESLTKRGRKKIKELCEYEFYDDVLNQLMDLNDSFVIQKTNNIDLDTIEIKDFNGTIFMVGRKHVRFVKGR